MTGDSRCRGPKKMMGRGADGGCGTEEKSCPLTRPAPVNIPSPAPVESSGKFEQTREGVDLYTHALKALSERSPFDSNEILATTVPTLPSSLASLLSKHADSRKKHKRPHSDIKSNRKSSTEKSKSSNIWIELDDYFRELTLQDIERLHRLSSSFASSSSTSDSCFSIPAVGNARRTSTKNIDNGNGGNGSIQAAVAKQEEAVCADDRVSDCRASEIQEFNGEIEQQRDAKVDSGNGDSSAVVEQPCSPQPQGSSQSCSSVEWVLGSRNRVLLTTTRPTKKRKLLGETAGLEKLIVAQPCEGSSSLCHVCSMGDTRDQMNQLVICDSCNVVVHQKCYGVQGEVDGSWLCTWCRHIGDVKAGQPSVSDRPCVLCPKTGGAMKRFQGASGASGGSNEFAHLFCSQWMPEVYIDDTRLMEPLLSAEEIKDVRTKLLCNLCKVRIGSCVRCSDGSCRTSFHPICAREAKNKLEVWGKFGCDDIELRAFCAKHSGSTGAAVNSDQTLAVAADSLATSYQPAVVSVNKIKKLKIGCKNGDKVTLNIGAADSKSPCESQDMGLKDAGTNLKSGVVDAHGVNDVETFGRDLSENVKTSCLLDLCLILKKLMDRGKVNLQQIASDIGISADSLASKIAGNHLGAELYSKIIMWLRDHAYMDTKDLTSKVKCLIPSKAMLGADDSSDTAAVTELDMPDVVPVKSVPSRRRTVGKIGILKEDELMYRLNDNLMGNGVSVGEGTDRKGVADGAEKANSNSNSSCADKIVVETIEFEDRLVETSPRSESPNLKSDNLHDVERNGSEEGTDSGKSSLVDLDLDIPSSSVDVFSHCEGDIKCGAESFVHPYIQKKLEEVQSWLSQSMPPKCDGCAEHTFSSTEQPSDVDVCGDNKNLPVSFIEDERGNGMDLHKAKQMGNLNLNPENEVEGEIIFCQQRLLDNAFVRKRHADQLICKIVQNLPHQMDAVRKQRWDDVLVNQYVHELKEARKQGRKEKRYKEAQAVLAAATAAAAASSRISSLRKDIIDELLPENQLKLGTSRVRGQQTISNPRVKETHASLGLLKVMSDRYPDKSRLVSGSPKGHPRSCDICSRPESLLNSILVCSSCKVAVHLSCYRSVKESTGPWYCELCEESSLSKTSGTAVCNSQEKPYPVAECVLCGTSAGAFRKSSNGEWTHAFCAEWVFDSTFKRGQVYPVEGMETVLKGNDVCSVCDRRYGVCIKCNYGNCQATFHPSCARSAGYYLYARSIGGGRTQRKAYCSKHSLEQRSKVETQKHAAEDLKIAKQHRVKLEKLRLLCERIVKREKLKRDLVICNHDILASKRDSLVISRPLCHSYLSHEVSSESATTSLKGHTDGSRSCSEAIQKSDDVTVDSGLSSKKCIKLPLSMDNDQKTDDSSTSQHLPTPKLTDRVSFGGKQIPIRAAMACRNFTQRGEKRLKSKKHAETFKKELVMTSDQALMKNQRLPKGYIYVPMDSLANGKQVTRDSVETKEQDG